MARAVTHRPPAVDRRERLLDAARALAGERGIGAITHRALAERAGVAPSNTTYFFSSMAELLDTAVRHFAAQEESRIAELIAAAPTDISPDEVATLLVADAATADRVHVLAGFEVLLHSARHDEPLPPVAELLESRYRLAEAGLRALGAVQPATGARALVALLDGFALQRLAAPAHDDDEALRQAVVGFLRAYTREPAPT